MIENIEIKRVEKFERKQISRLLRNGACYITYLITKPDGTKIGLSKIGTLLQTFNGLDCFEKGRIIHNDFTPFESAGEMSFEEFVKDSGANEIPKLYLRYSFTDKTYMIDEEPQKKDQEDGSNGLEINDNVKTEIIEIQTKENLETKIEEVKENIEKLEDPGFISLNIDFEDYIITDLKYPDELFKSKSKKEFTFNSIENINIDNFENATIYMFDRQGGIIRKIQLVNGILIKKDKYYISCESFD